MQNPTINILKLYFVKVKYCSSLVIIKFQLIVVIMLFKNKY